MNKKSFYFIKMDTANYMTNNSEVELNDDEMIQKNAQLTKENEAFQQELQNKEKEMKELQRKLNALQIEYDHQIETAKNNENLLSFYKNQAESKDSKEEAENKIKDLEVKLLMAESKNEDNESFNYNEYLYGNITSY